MKNFVKKFVWEFTLAGLLILLGLTFVHVSHDEIPIVHAQSQAPCVVTGTLSAAGQSTIIDNRKTGCYQWRVSYANYGFSVISIQLEEAPDSNGSPGSWTAFTGTTVVTDGSNPSTSTNSAIIGIHSGAAFVRLNLVTATGTGYINYQVWGANSTSNIAGFNGATGPTGATGSTGATGATGVTYSVYAGGILAEVGIGCGFPFSGYNANCSASTGVAVASTIFSVSKLYWLLSATPSVSTSLTITLQKNGSNTTLTCTVANPATFCLDNTHSISVAVGDTLQWVETAGTGTNTTTHMDSISAQIN